jgi:hypothetical protein
MSPAFTLFLMFDAIQFRVPVSLKWFTRSDTVELFDIGHAGNAS